jgi:hypothetical protein
VNVCLPRYRALTDNACLRARPATARSQPCSPDFILELHARTLKTASQRQARCAAQQVARFKRRPQAVIRNARREVVNPKLATLEAIERVHGVAVDATRRGVDESELDGNQFYPRKSNIQLDSQDLLRLRAFKSAYERNVGNALPRVDIERFIEPRGLAVRLTSKGEAVLKR